MTERKGGSDDDVENDDERSDAHMSRIGGRNSGTETSDEHGDAKIGGGKGRAENDARRREMPVGNHEARGPPKIAWNHWHKSRPMNPPKKRRGPANQKSRPNPRGHRRRKGEKAGPKFSRKKIGRTNEGRENRRLKRFFEKVISLPRLGRRTGNGVEAQALPLFARLWETLSYWLTSSLDHPHTCIQSNAKKIFSGRKIYFFFCTHAVRACTAYMHVSWKSPHRICLSGFAAMEWIGGSGPNARNAICRRTLAADRHAKGRDHIRN